ncbi:hypothetical protein [Micromonospora maritima]|uniref:hypothetical protein n=1 Tax=Micromonospora maritima TaxID=986711 RepID=UPI00157D01B3|nr:hypothetical protein [Micromonospora maritima]
MTTTCEACGSEKIRIHSTSDSRFLYLCACWKGYPRAKIGWAGGSTAYCINIDCDCRPAGRNPAYGAMTGRARWQLGRDPQAASWSEVTLCGGCYRRVRHVVAAGDPADVLATLPSPKWP